MNKKLLFLYEMQNESESNRIYLDIFLWKRTIFIKFCWYMQRHKMYEIYVDDIFRLDQIRRSAYMRVNKLDLIQSNIEYASGS